MSPASPGIVAWLTGLPASGKSTLAREAKGELWARSVPCCVLDGDDVRASLHPAPGYDDDARASFYATLCDLAVLLAAQGLVVLVAATAHKRAFRERARSQAPRFVEILVRCDQAKCAERDPKGLYAQARAGAIDALPGASLAYEEPASPDLTIDTTSAPPGEGAAAVVGLLNRLLRGGTTVV